MLRLINCKKLNINPSLIRRLVDSQFPQWKKLPIHQVKSSNWGHKDFYLGDKMSIRVPSASKYSRQLQKEHRWLPKFARFLPLQIPELLALGEPTEEYPWHWMISRRLEGEAAASVPIANACDFASSLAEFLLALQKIDVTNGPSPGDDNFFAGDDTFGMNVYDLPTALSRVGNEVDVDAAAELWQEALNTAWDKAPLWVHGQINVDNLLVKDGQLYAVNNFNLIAVGDPACDLTIAWTLFSGNSREIFRSMFTFDPNTWLRARTWVLCDFINTAAGLMGSCDAEEKNRAIQVIKEVLRGN